MKRYISSIFLITATLFFLFAMDLWLFFLVGKQCSFFTLALLIAALFSPHNKLGVIIGCCVLILSGSLVMSGSLWLPLLYLLPAIIIITAIRPHVYPRAVYPPLAAGLCIGITLSFSSFWGTSPYTIGIIFGNMMITWLFSLKLKTGKIRQSLTIST